MDRYGILLRKTPPARKSSTTAAAPNLVVDAYGRLLASSKPQVGSPVYVNDQVIGYVYNVDLSSNQVEMSLTGTTTTNMAYRFPYYTG